MGMTLWQKWTQSKPVEKPLELQCFNPLGVKVGDLVTLDVLDYRSAGFKVEEIRENDRGLGEKAKFADYVLIPFKRDSGRSIRLRCYQTPDRTMSYQAVILEWYDGLPFDQGLADHCNAETGFFEVFQDGVLQESFSRVGGLRGASVIHVRSYKDDDGSGEVDLDEVETFDMDCWDYVRDAKDEAGQPYERYLIVEMDKRNGWFEIWTGHTVDPERVMLF